MRRIKFEQIKRSSLNNFVRDAKKYLLNKRKQSVEVVKTRKDSHFLFNNDIKIIKEEKDDHVITNPYLQPKQKEFIRYVLNTLKKDGQKGRTKDLHVKKMLVDLFSFDLKHSIKDKTIKVNPLQLYNSNAENVVQKYTKSNYLSNTLKKDILRKIVPRIE